MIYPVRVYILLNVVTQCYLNLDVYQLASMASHY